MKDYIFTDLAFENFGRGKCDGICAEEYRCGTKKELTVLEWALENEAQAAHYGRPCGRYVTVLAKAIWLLDEEEHASLRDVLCDLLLRLLLARLPHGRERYTLLIAGLGNSEFAVDAVGPQTAEKLQATRCVLPDVLAADRLFSVATMTPGVLAKTGMEAAEQIRGVARVIGADAVIAVDALAASHYERLGTTVQISDSGICPGSGVGNAKKAINEESIGVPVISLGVPTVIDSATLICDALRRGGVEKLSTRMRASVEAVRGYFVCPKASDLITASISFLLADVIDRLGVIKRRDCAYSEPSREKDGEHGVSMDKEQAPDGEKIPSSSGGA